MAPACEAHEVSQLYVHLALVLGQAINGGGSIVARMGLPKANPVLFALMRESFAAPLLVMLAVAVDGRASLHATLWTRRDIAVLFLASVALFSNQIAYIAGLKLTNPVVGSAWQPSQPVFVLGIAVLLRWEACSALKLLGVLCALLGGGVMTLSTLGDSSLSGGHDLVGNLLFFYNCVGTAVYVLSMRVVTRRMPPYSGLAVTYVGATAGMVLTALVVSGTRGLPEFFCPDCDIGFWEFPLGASYALTYWVLGNSVAGYLCLTFGARHARDSTHCLAYTALQPVVAGLLQAALVLGGWNEAHPDGPSMDLPRLAQVAGACIIVAGVASVALDARVIRNRSGLGRFDACHQPLASEAQGVEANAR